MYIVNRSNFLNLAKKNQNAIVRFIIKNDRICFIKYKEIYSKKRNTIPF